MDFAYFATTAGEEWREWAGRNAQVSGDSIGLATEPTITYTNLRVEAVDVTVDADGNVLTLDEGGTIYQYDVGNERAEPVWSAADSGGVEAPQALCVFGDRIYVADGASGDLVVLSRRSGDIVGRFDAGLDAPIDIVRTDRRLYVLDAGTGDTGGRVLTLRRSGMVETVAHGLASPVDLAADGSHLYIVERSDGTTAIRIHDVGHIESPSIVPTSRTIDEFIVAGTDDTVTPIRVGVLGDQELVLVGREAGREQRALYHYAFNGAEWTLTRRDEFALTCSELLAGPRRTHRRYPKYYAIAGERNHVYIIDERQTNKRNVVDGRYSAQAYRRLDSGAIDTEWHRLTLGFDAFPANTQVVASYHATNERTDLVLDEAVDGVSAEEAEELREAGVEGPWDLLERDVDSVAAIIGDESIDRVGAWIEAAVDAVDRGDWTSTDAANQGDVLLEDVGGRYLHVKLDLVGSVDASPQIGSFRAFCPKLTYVRYLPEQFQRRGEKRRFLERYLSVFESEFVDLEAEIDRISRFFDPEAVPNRFLSWLGEWLAIEFDEEWPDGAKRDFLIEAPELFRMRGTKHGMDRRIRQYLERVEAPDTSWMSRWQKRRIEARRSEGWLGDEEAKVAFDEIDSTTEGFGDGHMLFFLEHRSLDHLAGEVARRPYTMHMRGPQSFVIFAGPFVDEVHGGAVARLVAADKPAHTYGRVVELKQECKLEGSSFLGVNTTLTTREFVLGTATLGGDTVLRERGSPLSGADA